MPWLFSVDFFYLALLLLAIFQYFTTALRADGTPPSAYGSFFGGPSFLLHPLTVCHRATQNSFSFLDPVRLRPGKPFFLYYGFSFDLWLICYPPLRLLYPPLLCVRSPVSRLRQFSIRFLSFLQHNLVSGSATRAPRNHLCLGSDRCKALFFSFSLFPTFCFLSLAFSVCSLVHPVSIFDPLAIDPTFRQKHAPSSRSFFFSPKCTLS